METWVARASSSNLAIDQHGLDHDPPFAGKRRATAQEDLALVNEFYRRLFELAPEVRPMFKREVGLQAKKFSNMLAWVITHLEHPDELRRQMRELGARHKGYGVEIDQYAPIGSALIWMFQHTLGDRFTRDMEEAWLEFYAFLSFEMEHGSREAAATGINR